MFEEGTIADGPNGPIIFQGGRWVPMGGQSAGPMTVAPNPARVRRDQIDIAGSQLKNQIDAATAADQIAKARADAQRAQAEAAKATAELARGGLTHDQQAERQAKITQFNALVGQINRVQTLYDQSVGKTKGLKGLLDYAPSDANARFDAAGAALSQQGLGAFRIPGTGTVSDRDAIMFDRANLPTADTRDSAIEEQLRSLRARLEQEYASRGLPAPQWVQPNAMDQVNVVGGGVQARTPGANSVAPLPPEAQAEYQAYIAQNAGRLDPNEYAQFRLALSAKYRLIEDPSRASVYAQEAQQYNEYYAKGGRTFGTPVVEKPLSSFDAMRSDAVNNPLGAAAVNLADAGGFGAVTALAGDQMAALRDANPISSMVGGAIGAVGATSGLGALARAGAQRLAPQTLGGAGRAQFGRNLATDATYGGIYGGMTEGDPLTGALVGGVASGLGQGVGSALGRTIGGLDMTAPARALRDRGISLTTGQAMGGLGKRLEDRMMSIPGVGDLIQNRRIEGLQDFNRAALNDAGASVGALTNQLGEAGLDDLMRQIGGAYDNATAGVTVPLDPQFAADLASVGQKSRMLPPDLSSNFSAAMDNAVQPIYNAGQMTGDQFQQSMRGLKGYKAEATKPGFEADYRDALTKAQEALTQQMRRGGGASVVEGLDSANAAYRNAKVLENAMGAAKNNSSGAGVQVFTPAQVNTAAYRAAAKYPGARPFADLADNAQEVLPSQVPDSGTAGRLLGFALPAGLAGGAAGADQFGFDGASKALAAAALLSAGGTKAGQKALNKMLFDRPDIVVDAGRFVRKKKGLFGSASVPLLLEATK